MTTQVSIRGRLLQIGGCCLLAASVSVPVAMSSVSARAHDFAKLLSLVPLSVIGFICVTIALGWRGVVGGGKIERSAGLALVGFVAIAGITTVMAESSTIAFIGRFYRPEGLATWFSYAAALFGLLAWLRYSGRGREFVDVMLVTSLVPAGYAVQQGLGLDFYSTPGIEGRVIGTQGGPGLLGSYLAMMLVVTLDRCIGARRMPVAQAVCLGLMLVQVAALWLSQARGPLIAALLGCTLLLGLVAIGRGSRRGVWLSALAIPIAVVLVGALNWIEPLQKWAQTVSGLNRVVFDLTSQASRETSLSSRSVISRLGTWQAGNETFLQASWPHAVFGFGPESAQPAYFPHIPATVMAAEDFRTVQNFDRLHAQSLDMTLNFGVVGWGLLIFFVSAAVLAAGNRLYGCASASGRGLALLVVCFGFGAMGCTLAAGLGEASAPAAGVGVAAAWGTYLCHRAIRKGTGSDPDADLRVVSGPLPVAGIAVGLVVFWADAQVNFALLTGHLAAFTFVALLLNEGGGPAVTNADYGDAGAEAAYPWAFEFSIAALLSATLSGFLAPFAASESQALREFWLRLTLPVVIWLFATALYWSLGHRQVRQRWRRWVAVTTGVPMAYAIFHLSVRPSFSIGFEIPFIEQIAVTRILVAGFALLISIVYGGWLAARAGIVAPARLGFRELAALSSAAALLIFFVPLAWRALIGDVAVGSVHLVARDERSTVDELAEIAVSAAPWEWRHHSDLIYRRLGHALALLGPAGVPPDRSAEFVRELEKADVAARNGLKLFANEPWAVLAMAQVLQVRGLNVLRSLYPETGVLAVREAGASYAAAHRMFPSQPLALQGWAQLSFDNGELAEGNRLLDLMEAIIPREPEPYFDRLAAALRAGDEGTVRATLAKAKQMLKQNQVLELEGFVATQKK